MIAEQIVAKDSSLTAPPKTIWPEVSVIIVNFNGAWHLQRCLTALQAQTVAPGEIILVDNASTDGSREILAQFPKVRLLLQTENLGFARGNNLAIKEASATSEWIALLNADAFVAPTWLEVLQKATHEAPNVHAFGSKLLSAADPKRLDGVGDAYFISGRIWRKGHGQTATADTDQVREIFSPCAAAALYLRSALNAVGGFDEDYFCYVEDVDLGFRLRLAGYRCLLVPSAVAYHVGSGSSGGRRSDFAVYYGHRNLVWTYLKNMPGWLFWVCLPLHLVLNLMSLFLFFFRGQGRVILRAKWDAFRGLREIWQKRQTIQGGRRVAVLDILAVLQKGI